MIQPLILDQKYGLPIKKARAVSSHVSVDHSDSDHSNCDEDEVSGLLSNKKRPALIKGLEMENEDNIDEGSSSSKKNEYQRRHDEATTP